jgi:3-deoxy-7-phosphoheptulonate synthase
MMIVWLKEVTELQKDALEKFAQKMGFETQTRQVGDSFVTSLLGEGFASRVQLRSFPGVARVVPLQQQGLPPLLKARREKTVQVRNLSFGQGNPVIIAGPCSIESEEQMLSLARNLKEMGVQMLRGGAFKPRTSPYSFQGLGHEGLDILARVSLETDLPVVSEVMSVEDLEQAEAKIDMVQVGARNMQNYSLLKALAEREIPVLLKRGISATIHEFLMAAEYLLSGGNEQVVLCERGVRGFEPLVRYNLDLASLSLLKELSPLPLIVDPSHACGQAALVPAVSRACIALGVDGLMLEVHQNPEDSISDADQALNLESFRQLLGNIHHISDTSRSKQG